MLQALLTRAETATPEQAEGLQDLLHQGFALSSSPDRDLRVAFAQEAQAFAQPVLLKAMYGRQASGSSQSSDISSYEAKLLQVGKWAFSQKRTLHLGTMALLINRLPVYDWLSCSRATGSAFLHLCFRLLSNSNGSCHTTEQSAMLSSDCTVTLMHVDFVVSE